mmetsp:Transcript_7184/g.13181  ORF Transcript_7184/g.13181 Transcript_7184/m.13181 type:complete len:222 (+) Transcript_7184:291-956(+)
MSLRASPVEGTAYPLTLVLTEAQLNHFADRELMENLRRSSQIFSLTLSNHDSSDPEDRGHISMQDQEFDKVMRCFKYIVDELSRVDDRDSVRVVMQIPERIISQVFGREFKLIERITASTKAQIAFIERSSDGTFRKLSISGEHMSVKQAVGDVYRSVLRNRNSALELSCAQFIIPSNCAGFIIGREGSFTKGLRESYNVDAKVYKANGPPCQDSESILVR